jgi:hypothetical protein
MGLQMLLLVSRQPAIRHFPESTDSSPHLCELFLLGFILLIQKKFHKMINIKIYVIILTTPLKWSDIHTEKKVEWIWIYVLWSI